MLKVLCLLALVTTAASCNASQPASAQGFNIRKNALPDASQIERSRLRVQIVDKSPIVTDTRKDEDSTTYLINVPPRKRAVNNVVQIGDGGVTNSGPSSVPIQSNNLPNSAFKSNIPVGGVSKSGPLPPGANIGRLGLVSARKLPASGNVRPASPQTVGGASVQTLKTYEPIASTPVAVMASRHTFESVKAELHRGDLVHK